MEKWIKVATPVLVCKLVQIKVGYLHTVFPQSRKDSVFIICRLQFTFVYLFIYLWSYWFVLTPVDSSSVRKENQITWLFLDSADSLDQWSSTFLFPMLCICFFQPYASSAFCGYGGQLLYGQRQQQGQQQQQQPLLRVCSVVDPSCAGSFVPPRSP